MAQVLVWRGLINLLKPKAKNENRQNNYAVKPLVILKTKRRFPAEIKLIIKKT